MSQFEILKSNNDLQAIIKTVFDAELDISGSWGYTQALTTIIHTNTMPLMQLEHMFASMRAYVEMNMTKEKPERYGSINVNELLREEVYKETLLYHKVTYEITAIKEEQYAQFINDYKQGYGKEDFDLAKHFKERKTATLTRKVIHWFEISSVN